MTLNGVGPTMLQFLRYSPDGKTLAVGNSFVLGLWDVGTRQTRAELEIPPSRRRLSPGAAVNSRGFHCCDFSPDGASLATGEWDRAVRVWDVPSGRLRTVFRGHDQGVISVAFSPDKKVLASAGSDKTVRLWDMSPARPGRTQSQAIEVHSVGGAVWCVVYSPDGKLLAVALADGTARLYEAEGFRMRASFGKAHRLTGVAFSPDGKLLAAGGADSSVTLWDVADLLGRSTVRAPSGAVAP